MTSFSEKHPELAAQWHPTLNEGLTPDMVGLGSTKKIWWQCPLDARHVWPARVPDRIKSPGCAVCSNQRIVAGCNDLATTCPEVAAQWHPKLNNDLTPQMVGSGSNKKVWWQCKKNPLHEWPGVIKDRVAEACPVCSGQLVITGVNDMATTRPDLAAQWHVTLNKTLLPTQIVAGSAKVIYWQCGQHADHVWKAKGSDRVAGGYGCPYCSNKKVLAGYNDMATTHPEISMQWHGTRNGKLTAKQVVAGTHKELWWTCSAGHDWKSSGARRVAGAECPYCLNKKVLVGYNDMATTHPELAEQLHPTLNESITAQDIVAGTGKVLWWLCEQGHHWDITGAARVAGSGCPVCQNRKILIGYNDLQTTHPELAKQFDLEANYPLTAQDVVAGSSKVISWVCPVNPNHRWGAKVTGRSNKNQYGCRQCWYEASVSVGKEELAQFIVEKLPSVEVLRNQYLTFQGKRRNYDIVVPALGIAVEYSEMYFHSEACGADSPYHRDKQQVAAGAGYRVIYVWEDDWINNREVVRQMLSHKLGVSDLPRVAARKTTISTLTSKQAEAFLEAHHIQGYVSGSLRLALKYNNEVVAVLVSRVQGEVAEIVRYATSAVVPGGFTKLLAALEKLLLERNTCEDKVAVTRLKTFSDHTISDGALYRNCGFTAAAVLEPDYNYLVKGRRVHKFNYRISRFKTDPALEYVEGETEAQLAARNKLNRVWDAGKTRWEKLLTKPIG